VEKPDRDVPDPSRASLLSHNEREALRAELASAPHYPAPWSTSISDANGDSRRDDEHAWILTYLDMLTLVLVLFIVLLAYTRPGEEEALSWTEGSIIELVNYQNPSIEPPLTEEPPSTRRGNSAVTLPIPELPPALEKAMENEKVLEGVEVHSLPGRVELRIRDGVLFDTGEAYLLGQGRRLMNRLAPLLAQTPGRIAVEGHTDNVPIANEEFPSNWELSAARASVVVRFLIEHGLDPARMQAVGLADTQPLAGNDTPEGRAANRRVSLVIRSAPDAQAQTQE
jgi:chemotaxis protein MotB